MPRLATIDPKVRQIAQLVSHHLAHGTPVTEIAHDLRHLSRTHMHDLVHVLWEDHVVDEDQTEPLLEAWGRLQ